MKALKIIGITILSLVLTVCIGVDAWWAYVYFNAPKKVTVTTHNIDLQTLSTGEQKPLIEVQLFRNKDGKGLPVYEIRYNTVTDESRSAFYSYGAQYVGNDLIHGWTGEIKYSAKDENFDGFQQAIGAQGGEVLSVSARYGKASRRQYYYLGLRQNFKNADTYFYKSGSDFYNAFGATKLMEDNEVITATIKTGNTGDSTKDYDIIGMRFKAFNNWEYKCPYDWEAERNNPNNYIKNVEDYTYLGMTTSKLHDWWFNKEVACIHYYGAYDSNYLATYLYDEIKNLPAGTDSYDITKLVSCFDYSNYINGSYNFDVPLDNSKIEELDRTYLSLKVSIHDEGLTKAEDSLFKTVKNMPDFNLTGDYTEDSYFIGRTNVNLDETSFTFVNISDNNYALKLKQSFVDYYSKYYDLIVLNININLESLQAKNINVVGFTEDSGLDNFVVHSSNVPTSEVAYV